MSHDPCAQESFPLCYGAERIVSQERRVQTMNCVSSKLADTYRNVEYIADPMSLLEDEYATTPMAAVQPAFRKSGEEEVYTSLEQDIAAITALLPGAANSSRHESVWQRTLLVVCLCLMLVMLGFDLMGVLLVYGGR